MCGLTPDLKGWILAVGIAMTPVADVQARAMEPRPDWEQAQRRVAAALAEPGAEIAVLLERARGEPPRTGQEALDRLALLLSGGLFREAAEALPDLKRLCPDLGSHNVESIYYEACDRLKAWDFARVLLETFAESVSELALYNRLLQHWERSGRSVDEIDAWFADRPYGRQGFWAAQRLRFNVRHGRGEALAAEWAERVRAAPRDATAACVFFHALASARSAGMQRWDVAWAPGALQPQRATEMDDLAAALGRLGAWAEAESFLRQAMETELTDAEVGELERTITAFIPPETLRAMFAVGLREALAGALLKQDRATEAQRWMVEADDMRAAHGLGRAARFAGEVQGRSGQRQIEGRIRDEEDRSESDPQYWSARAAYYRGRGETAEEEDALRRGLALTEPRPTPGRAEAPASAVRGRALSDYAYFLVRQKRTNEAVALLREELESAEADSASAGSAARFLAFELPQELRPDDPVVWTWIERRASWEYLEERLLGRTFERTPREALEDSFSRAEALARGAHPSRSYTLGWIQNRMRHPARSIPLLEDAVSRAGDGDLRERARFALFESLLDTHEWQRAEALWPEARGRLTPSEQPRWWGKIALAALRAGDRDAALRLWTDLVRAYPTANRGLDELAAAGLRDDLVAFYRDLALRLPGSDAPARALEILER